MAEDALPKDERRQTMKRIIAILLALIMIFAFAACKSKEEHSQLGGTIKEQLASLGDDGKDPGIMAKSMSWIKTNVKLGMNDSDRTVAGLMTDGCDMGIKSLTRYLNEYKGADGASRSTARRLIGIEEDLLCGLRPYL